jgi:hypothetical protein
VAERVGIYKLPTGFQKNSKFVTSLTPHLSLLSPSLPLLSLPSSLPPLPLFLPLFSSPFLFLTRHTRPSLRRFDSVDVDGKNVFIGQTTLFKQFTITLNQAIPQKMTVANEKGETKLIILKGGKKENMMEELREACMKKFQVKKKKAVLTFFTLGGESLENIDALCEAVENRQIVFKIT